MSAASIPLQPGTVYPLSAGAKRQWELGDVRQIAAGGLGTDGSLTTPTGAGLDWHLSIRSIERAGTLPIAPERHTVVLLSGDFLQLNIDGRPQGLEPLRSVHFDASLPVEVSRPSEELLVLYLAARPHAVRSTMRIVELSKKREQHLFDGQLGILIQGGATVHANGSEQVVQPRDTVIGGDDAEVRLAGRGFLAVVSLDPAKS